MLRALPALWWQLLHSAWAVAAVSVFIAAAAWPFLVLHSCSVILPRVRAAALPLWEQGAYQEEGVSLTQGYGSGLSLSGGPGFASVGRMVLAG